MKEPHRLLCYEYVNHPYPRVRDVLRKDALSVFQRATAASASRAHALAANLRVEIGGLDVGTAITIQVRTVEESEAAPGMSSMLRLRLTWAADRAPAIFPSMEADLTVCPLSSWETQLDLAGRYQPPLGVLGSALDTVFGHRIAEAAVHRFLKDVAVLLDQELAAPARV